MIVGGVDIPKIKKTLRDQLGATEADLQNWKDSPYTMSPHVAEKFWNLVKEAPATVVVGDYDCDGICATYIMSRAILCINNQIGNPKRRHKVRIPKRFSEGYGLSNVIVNEIIHGIPGTSEPMPKGTVVITVDNGIAAYEQISALKDAGFIVALTDHHELAGREIPPADIVLNPAIDGTPFLNQHWCGAAVALKLAEHVVPSEQFKELESIAGLATVADSMPLREGNWGLVKRTIENFKNHEAPHSLVALLPLMKRDPYLIDEETLSFYLGPAFNAPGRLYDNGAIEVVKYLFKPTPEKAAEIVKINEERRKIRDEQVAAVEEYIENNNLDKSFPIWVELDGLHEGVVGIIAGKVAEKYGKPAIVLTNHSSSNAIDSEVFYKGSARSIGDFDIMEYLTSCGAEFIAMGGHPGAAGLSMDKNEYFKMLEKSKNFNGQAFTPPAKKVEPITPEDIPALANVLDVYRPFGEGNEAPEFSVEVDVDTDPVKFSPSKTDPDVKHLFMSDIGKHYKITHFSHEPNDLSNKSRFMLIGKIKTDVYGGKETPAFFAEETEDVLGDNEKTR